jgi:hypothetical protein
MQIHVLQRDSILISLDIDYVDHENKDVISWKWGCHKFGIQCIWVKSLHGSWIYIDFKLKKLDRGGISCSRRHYFKKSWNQRSRSRKSLNLGLPSLTGRQRLPTLQRPSQRVVNRRRNPRAGEAQRGDFFNPGPKNSLPLGIELGT